MRREKSTSSDFYPGLAGTAASRLKGIDQQYQKLLINNHCWVIYDMSYMTTGSYDQISILGIHSWLNVHEGPRAGYLFVFFSKTCLVFSVLYNLSPAQWHWGDGYTQCNTRLLYLWQSQRLRNFLKVFFFPLSDRGKKVQNWPNRYPTHPHTHHPGSTFLVLALGDQGRRGWIFSCWG